MNEKIAERKNEILELASVLREMGASLEKIIGVLKMQKASLMSEFNVPFRFQPDGEIRLVKEIEIRAIKLAISELE